MAASEAHHLREEASLLYTTASELAHNYRNSTTSPQTNTSQNTTLQHRTRAARGFHETESQLPDIQISPAADDRPTILQDAASYLGERNPFALPVLSGGKDTVWVFDNCAFLASESELDRENGHGHGHGEEREGGEAGREKWKAEFLAAVFDKDTGVDAARVVADVAEKIGVGHGQEQEGVIRERLMPLMKTVLPGRVVDVDFASSSSVPSSAPSSGSESVVLKLGPGGRNGISSDIRTVSAHADGAVVESRAKVPQGTDGLLGMRTFFAGREGWGVISDIDDSIKVTQTSDPIGILTSTFVSPAQPIEGMPELYAWMNKLLSSSSSSTSTTANPPTTASPSPSPPFFYLSASPYNLYSFLRSFRDTYYPFGTLILRDASWQNLSGLLSNLTLGTREYKVERMEKIHGWLPYRKMVCVGDSTQADPESYGEIYRKFPGWVQLILIRKVTDIAAVGITEKNEPERFEKAFEGVPKDRWYVFEKPEECYDVVQRIVGGAVGGA